MATALYFGWTYLQVILWLARLWPRFLLESSENFEIVFSKCLFYNLSLSSLSSPTPHTPSVPVAIMILIDCPPTSFKERLVWVYAYHVAWAGLQHSGSTEGGTLS